MKRKTKALKSMLLLMIAIVILLAGCRSSTDIASATADISKVSPAAGFLAAKVEESRGFIASSDQRDHASAYAYLYDNALSVIALSYAGAQWHAETIADAIVFAQEHDRAFHDGRLRNAYISGDPKSDSGRSIVAGNVTIRLPGFWQDGRWQEDSYTVSTSTGNMAWTILALCTVSKTAADAQRQEYLAAAVRAADFVLGLQSDSGGFTAGCEGWDDAQIKATYKSTEHNISLIGAFSELAEVIAERDPEKAAVYAKAAAHAEAFVRSMYDHKLHCFYTGTKADGTTISDAVIPLDTNSLAVLVFGKELEDAYQTILFLEERMAVGEGFDFSAGDLDGIWNEGTAQMAVCYSMLKNTKKYDSTMAYLKTQTDKDGSIAAADRDGVSTGFAIAGSDMLWEYYNVQSISATGWLAFAQMNKNPFGSVWD